MLSFQNEQPDNKLFFLGALAGVARAGVARAGAARAGVARAGVARAGAVRPPRPTISAPIKLSINPSSQKTENNTTINDYSTNSTIMNNK